MVLADSLSLTKLAEFDGQIETPTIEVYSTLYSQTNLMFLKTCDINLKRRLLNNQEISSTVKIFSLNNQKTRCSLDLVKASSDRV